MNITLLTDGIWPMEMGGIQKHSYNFAKYLAKNKNHVTVYYPKSSYNSISNDLELFFNKEDLKYLTFVQIKKPLSYKFPGHYLYERYLYSKNIYNFFKFQQIETDIIYIQGYSGWFLQKKYRKHIRKFKTVLNFHGLEMFQNTTGLKPLLEKLILRCFALINIKRADFAVSLGGKLTSILKKYNQNVITIPVGIDHHFWFNSYELNYSSQNKISFVFIGRYERRKGIEELNKVLKNMMYENNCTLIFHFIGPIPDSKKIVGNSKIELYYHGKIIEEQKVKSILNRADILVCPSWSEGMPTVILEAMASGCAIIATDVGAVNQLVDKNNGWLLPYPDTSFIRDTIFNAISLKPLEFARLKENSLKKAQDFTWDKITERTLKIFASIIHED